LSRCSDNPVTLAPKTERLAAAACAYRLASSATSLTLLSDTQSKQTIAGDFKTPSE